jgi:ABC-type transport system involved in multi-copper enzyme maturation permease subunit
VSVESRRLAPAAIPIVVGYALREALRRKVFAVVLVLTVVFLGLNWLTNHYAFRDVRSAGAPLGVDATTFVGATLLGLAMFATLFLGVVLAVFLTLGAVRGDAERGLLQPLVVRPLGRAHFLAARWLGAVAVCVPYVLAVYAAAVLETGLVGGWWPDEKIVPGLELAAGVALVAAFSLLGSVFLAATANGIAVFMVFGAGLVAGLLGTVGHALDSTTLKRAAEVAAWILPFEALYQDALRGITASVTGVTGFVLELGPFGGAYTGGIAVRLWALAYFVLVGALAVVAFQRRDL